jgi:hypothetical protein
MKTIASAGGNSNKLIVSLNSFKGKRTVDIRKFYLDKKTKEFLPTRKGITLTSESYNILKNSFKDFDEEITNWLEPNETATEVEKDLKSHSDSANRARFQKRSHSREYENWKSPVFFRAESRGGMDTIIYNDSHSFISSLKNSFDEIQRLDSSETLGVKEIKEFMDILLLSFSRAKNLYDNSPVISPDILFQDLVFNWGQLLSNYSKNGVDE